MAKARVGRDAENPAIDGDYLTVAEAAALLNVPASYLRRLVNAGAISSAQPSEQILIRRTDLLEYKATRDRKRREALRELSRESQRLGLFGRD